MAKYRKRPVVIEATQWFRNGDHPQDVCETLTGSDGEPFLSEGKVVRYYRMPHATWDIPCRHCEKVMHEHGWIDTLEGGHTVCPGDWIITGVENEIYNCKDSIFRATYEPVTEEVSFEVSPKF